MEIGYIKLYRKITNSFVWTNPNMLKLWLLCLMKASHSGNKFLFNGKEISVNSGEFVTGRDAITKEMNEGTPREHQVNSTSVWRWLKKFEEEEMLDIKSTTKYSVISIKNWYQYQVSEQQVNIKRTTSEQQVDTINNAKNAKNEKNLKDNSRKSAKRTYDEHSVHYLLAQTLFEKIKNNNPEAKNPNLQIWADDIRKMMELDGRKEVQVQNMIEWSQSHDFWSGVILSAQKLREKYDQMKTQALNDRKPKASGYNKPTKVEQLPDWANEPQPTEDVMMDEETQREFQERLKRFREGRTSGD